MIDDPPPPAINQRGIRVSYFASTFPNTVQKAFGARPLAQWQTIELDDLVHLVVERASYFADAGALCSES